MLRKLSFLSALLALAFSASSQIVSTSDTAFGPSIPTTRIPGPNPTTASVSPCFDTLVVQIPANRWVYSVDVQYNMLAANNGWKSEQFSYLTCTTTGNSEATISQGFGDQPGLQTYSRTGLNIANGATTTGTLVFRLDAFRTWGNPAGCDTAVNKVVHGTWVVTVNHGPMPTCFPPTGLQNNWVMSNSAQFSWTTGGASNWQLKYGAVGFNPNSAGTYVNAATTAKKITGLAASTSYDVYVRDSCGTGNSSMWVGPVTITTLCSPIVAPYLETFSGTAWTSGTGINNINNGIDACWTRDPGAPTGNGGGQPYSWGTKAGATITPNTGPNADHTVGTPAGKYVYTEASAGAYQDEAYLISPLMDISGLTNPSVTFWKHMFGQYTGTIALDVWTPTNGWQSNLWSQSGATQTSSAAAWDSINVPLTNLANDTIRIRFRAVRSFDVTGDMALDDVYFQNGPTCPQPTSLAATNTSFTSVSLAITTGAGTNWQLAYGTPAQTPGAMSKTVVSSTTPTLTGLTVGTDYAIYVRNICGAGDTSGWYGPLLVSTLCTPVSAPWSEDFDGTGWTAGTGTYNGGDALASCWFRDPSAGTGPGSAYFWGIRATPPTTNGTGPATDASGNGRFAYTESSSGLPAQVTTLRTPPINTSTLTTPELSFSYHARGNSMGSLGFQVWTPNGGWSGVTTVFSGNQPFVGFNPLWVDTAFTLPAADTLMVRFVATRGSANQSDMAIDEIEIKEAPACPAPSALAVGTVTTTTAGLSWSTGGASLWNVAFGPSGSVNLAAFNTATTNPYTLTGLIPGTTYDVYVRDSCGSGTSSLWIGPVTFTTSCTSITAPWTENFDGTFAAGTGNFNQNSTIDPCWSRNPAAGAGGPPFNQPYHWGGGTGATPTNNTGPTSDHTTGTGNYVYVEASAFNGASATLTTPEIFLDTLSNPEVIFWRHMFGTQIGTLNVEISANGGAWTNISTAQGSQGNSWQEVKANISAYAGDTIQLRFTSTKPGGGNQASGDIAIDDLTINNPLPCLPPSNISVQPFSNTSLEVTFTAGGGGITMIEYGPSGFTPGSGTLVAAASSPFIIPGLLTSTTYDVYVFDSCGIGQVSPKLGPYTQTTFNCQNGCQYTLDLVDTFGDGWTGNGAGTVLHNLEITTGTSITNFTFNAGFAASFTINVCDGDTLRVRFLPNGALANECGWYLIDSFGDTVNSFTPGTVPPAGYLLESNIQCTNPCPPTVANFTATANGLLGQFDASASTGNSLTYSWNYGTGGTATGANTLYNFPHDSTWNVQLVVTDLCGQTDTIVQGVTVCSPTMQSFTMSTNVLTLNCTGPAIAGRYSSIWYDFGNGTIVQGANASYTYPVGGNYTVTLHGVNACGDTLSTSQTITMCIKPTASFTWFIVSSNGNGMTVQFDATSSLLANTYTWYWGDGQSSTGANFIQHTYAVPSLLYNVTLVITNNCGLGDTVSHRLDEIGLDENGLSTGAWLFPNPTTTLQGLTLGGWQAHDAVSIVLTDAYGRTVQVLSAETDANGAAALPFKPLAAGLYFVRLSGEAREEVLRFVMEK